jgi:Holliday junction resolvase RusA-like endonuclease
MTLISQSNLTKKIKSLLGSGAITLFLSVDPVPASRPRVTRWGTYYGKTYERFRRDVKDILNNIVDKNTQTDKPLFAIIEVLKKPPKTVSRLYPRGDVDNYAKGPLDSMTTDGNFWNDDDQLISLYVTKRYTLPEEEEGIQITYKPIEV